MLLLYWLIACYSSQMAFLKSLLYSTGIWHQKRPRPLEFSILSKLPLELVAIIAQFLPPVSAVSFSLCCTLIYFLIGAKYLNKAKQGRFDTYALLALLERDLSDQIACYHCKKFHAIKHAKRYIYSKKYYTGWIPRQMPLCLLADSQARSWIHLDFSTSVFRMVMKRYRQGIDCSMFLELLSPQWQIFYHAEHIGKIASWCRIVRGSLLVRNQAVFPLRPSESMKFIFEHVHLVCPHYDWRAFGPNDSTSDLEWWYQKKNFEGWGQLMHCKYCATEFRIDIEYFEQVGKLVFFTRWQNLGKGRRPLDHQWQSHLAINYRPIWKKASFRPGSICSGFEYKQEFKFSSLITLKDKQKLFELPLESPWTKDIRLYNSQLHHFIRESNERSKIESEGIRRGLLRRRGLLYY